VDAQENRQETGAAGTSVVGRKNNAVRGSQEKCSKTTIFGAKHRGGG